MRLAHKGKQGLYVQGDYTGRLSAWGETLTLTDNLGRRVSTKSFVGDPSAAQRYLRITEIMYNPAASADHATDAQQFEFVQLKNVSTDRQLDLNGVALTKGIFFTFAGGAVPGRSVFVVRNKAAFLSRYGAGPFLVAGEFTGALDNAGETLRLTDGGGEEILEFAYNNSWYPVTEGLGSSLVIVHLPGAVSGHVRGGRVVHSSHGSSGPHQPGYRRAGPPRPGRLSILPLSSSGRAALAASSNP